MKHISLSNLLVLHSYDELPLTHVTPLHQAIASSNVLAAEHDLIHTAIKQLSQLPLYSPSQTSLDIIRAYSHESQLLHEV
jgi:hypothetical protein